jgi:hypothetical protein
MALAGPEGNRRNRLFPRLLLGLFAQMNLDCDDAENPLLSRDSMFPTNHMNADRPSATRSSAAAITL